MIEVDRQRQIVQAVRKVGGYAYKASNAYTSGIPDLVVIVSPRPLILVEVKDLGEVGAKFKRKVNLTPLQRETMSRINAVNGSPYAVVMVTYKRGSTVYVAVIPATQDHVTETDQCATLSNLGESLSSLLLNLGVK